MQLFLLFKSSKAKDPFKIKKWKKTCFFLAHTWRLFFLFPVKGDQTLWKQNRSECVKKGQNRHQVIDSRWPRSSLGEKKKDSCFFTSWERVCGREGMKVRNNQHQVCYLPLGLYRHRRQSWERSRSGRTAWKPASAETVTLWSGSCTCPQNPPLKSQKGKIKFRHANFFFWGEVKSKPG